MICRRFIIFICLSLAACSSPAPIQQEAPTPPPVRQLVTADTLLVRHQLLEFNDAATALRAIFDASLGLTAGSGAESILPCAISGEQARAMLQPMAALIDSKITQERAAYLKDPVLYEKRLAFEKCSSSCSCGILASLLESVAPKAMPRTQRSTHQKRLTKLQSLAAKQTPQETTACARQQSWFCSSELRSYLEREAAATE